MISFYKQTKKKKCQVICVKQMKLLLLHKRMVFNIALKIHPIQIIGWVNGIECFKN